MSVRVRMRPPDLSTVAQMVEFPEADWYRVCEDHTLELYRGEDVIGHVHYNRWDTVELTVGA